MKWLARSIVTLLVGGVALVTANVAPPSVRAVFGSAQADVPAYTSSAPPLSVASVMGLDTGISIAEPDEAPWVPPVWFPPTNDLQAISQMDAAGPRRGPSVYSRSVFVFDVDRGTVLFEKNADEVRPVASITKLVSALTLVSTGADLDNTLCVGAQQYPTRNGARSHLSTGDCLRGWDVLGAALVASDNRAAFGLAAVAQLDMDDFIAQMNVVSAEMGMTRSSWSDPSGLEDENLSSARDIARATIAVASHPVLSTVASAPFWDIHRDNAAPRRLYSTDRLAGRDDVLVEAAKTGYTDTARYCFTTALHTPGGRRLVITLLGADGKMTRWADVQRVIAWADGQPEPQEEQDGIVDAE